MKTMKMSAFYLLSVMMVLLMSSNLKAQTYKSPLAPKTIIQIIECTKGERVAVGSDNNVLRWAATNGLEQKWTIGHLDSDKKFFLNLKMAQALTIDGFSGNAHASFYTAKSEQFFTIQTVSHREAKQILPASIYNKYSPVLEHAKRNNLPIPLEFVRIGESTRKERLAVGSNGNVLRWSPINNTSQLFILLTDGTNLNPPSLPPPAAPHNVVGDWHASSDYYFEITKTAQGIRLKTKHSSGDDLGIFFDFQRDPNNPNKYNKDGDPNNSCSFLNNEVFQYRVNGKLTSYRKQPVRKPTTPPYKVKLTLVKLVVDYDGDWGIHDPGEVHWDISLNGNMITSRSKSETKELWENNTYQFSSLKKSNESTSIVLPKYSANDFVTYDLAINFFEKDGNQSTSFGETHEFFSFHNVKGSNPGLQSVKIDNGQGNVTLYYTVEVQVLKNGTYIIPSYPKFETFTGVKPDEELKFVLNLNPSEQVDFFNCAKGTGHFNAKEKLKKVSNVLEGLTENMTDLESQEELSIAFASVSLEIAIDGFAKGPVVGGVLLGAAAIVNGIAQPFIFAGVDYNLTVFVANYSDKPMKIKDFKKGQGAYIYGPSDGIIPAKVGDNVSVGIFVFKKNYGYDGIMGALEFGAFDDVPAIKIGYGVPYRDNAALQRKNQCLTQVGGNRNLNDFYTLLDKNTFDEKLQHTTSSSGWSAYSRIFSGVNSSMYVVIKEE